MSMNAKVRYAIAGVVVAIAVTTTMDATGYSVFSALPLLPIVVVFWLLSRVPRTTLGLTKGTAGGYGLALLHPAIAIGLLIATAIAMRIDLAHPDWRHVGVKILVNSLVGTLVTLLTEEGFFRGWLWGTLDLAGWSATRVLFTTSVAFAAWHISAVFLDTGFNPPARQAGVLLANALLLGIIWGCLRQRSGSIIVSAFAHSVWNAVAYALFGYGTKVGALGIRDTWLLGPEVGVLGLAVNVVFAAVLLRRKSH